MVNLFNEVLNKAFLHHDPYTGEKVMETTEKHQFDTGAVRSKDNEEYRFDLIQTNAIRRLAAAMKEGEAKYEANNWRKGIPIHNLLNHAIGHLMKFMDGDISEDHIGHALWNIATIAEMEKLVERKPEMFDIIYKDIHWKNKAFKFQSEDGGFLVPDDLAKVIEAMEPGKVYEKTTTFSQIAPENAPQTK